MNRAKWLLQTDEKYITGIKSQFDIFDVYVNPNLRELYVINTQNIYDSDCIRFVAISGKKELYVSSCEVTHEEIIKSNGLKDSEDNLFLMGFLKMESKYEYPITGYSYSMFKNYGGKTINYSKVDYSQNKLKELFGWMSEYTGSKHLPAMTPDNIK